MVEIIRNEYGSEDYVVKYDVDGNGRTDDVIFTENECFFDEESSSDIVCDRAGPAKEFEACYVKNDMNACRSFYMGSADALAEIRFFTKSGLGMKTCDNLSSYWPLTKVKNAIGRLTENFRDVSEFTRLKMAADLFNVISFNPDNGILKDLAVKHISTLNDIGKGEKLNSKQIDLLARLVVGNRGELGKMVLKGAADMFGGGEMKDSLFNAASSIFETCVKNNSDATCVDESIALTNEELADISIEFNTLTDCLSERGRELSDERTIQGIPCAKGSYVEYHENGRLAIAMLAQDHGIGDLTFKKGSKLTFKDDGTLETAELPQDQMLGGFDVSKGLVKFKGANKFSAFTLASDQTINNIELQKGMRVDFDGYYQPMAVVFEGVRYIQGIPTENHSINVGVNYFEGDGGFVNIYDGEHIKFLSGDPHYDDSVLGPIFYPEGQLKAAYLAKDHEIDGSRFPKGTQIEFHENGDLKTVILAADTSVRGVSLQKNDVVTFHRDNGPMVVYLSSERVINGTKYALGEELELLGDGEFKEAHYGYH